MREPKRTGSVDTVFGFLALGVAALLLTLAVAFLALATLQLSSAHHQLERTLWAVAAAQHRSPRDPAVLAEVARRLPGHVRLEPGPQVLRTGRVTLVRSRWFGGEVERCLVIPATPSRPIGACPRPAH